jgi:hypothetical protein
MNLKLPELDAKRFYQVGKYAFFTIALIGLIRILDLWRELKSYDVFSMLANSLFYFILSWFFSTLQSNEDIKEVNDGDIINMNEALDKLNLKGGKTNAKKR